MQTEPVYNLNFDLCWTDSHVKPELFARMQTHQKINHFPGTESMIHRNGNPFEEEQFGKWINAV